MTQLSAPLDTQAFPLEQLDKLSRVKTAAKQVQRERRRLMLGSPLGNEAMLLKAFDELDNALWNADSSLEGDSQ